MALWAFIPGKHLEAVGSLPQSARRLDTGQRIDDLPGVNLHWARACGWWNIDELAVSTDLLVATNKLTPDELAALTVEVTDVLTERQRRNAFLDDARTAWTNAKDQGQDRLDLIVPYTRPERPVVPVNAQNIGAWITYLEQNDLYLDNWARFLQRSLIGGGTIDTPGIGDMLFVVAQIVAGLLDQSTGVVLPQ